MSTSNFKLRPSYALRNGPISRDLVLTYKGCVLFGRFLIFWNKKVPPTKSNTQSSFQTLRDLETLTLVVRKLFAAFPFSTRVKCNLQVYLLFSTPETIATLVNYTCKSFIELTPVVFHAGYLAISPPLHSSTEFNIVISSTSHTANRKTGTVTRH